MKIKIVIQGITPLILHKFTDEAAMSSSSGTRTAVVGGDRGTPKEQAEKCLYKSNEGKLIIPGPNVFSAIIQAGSFHKAGKSKVTTQKSSLIPACMMIEEIEIPIQSKEGWQVDTRPVRIPATGGRVLKHRPIFNDWKLAFTIDLDESFMHEKLMRSIVDDMCKRVGLGDFRPGCKGPYGRSVVTNWRTEQ